MFEKMTEESISNGFVQNPIAVSNPPMSKKKRNLPGTPGKYLPIAFQMFFR